MSTITITFGDQAENHVGMQMIGAPAQRGYSTEDLQRIKTNIDNLGYVTEYHNLNELTNQPTENASVLVIRNGVNMLLSNSQYTIDNLFDEQRNLEWDKKAFMYGRVVNKTARYNLCYGEDNQEPDYENSKGRIISWNDIPCTRHIKIHLSTYFGELSQNLVAEGNMYYNNTKCGIGWHGDAERRIVIAMRLGDSMDLCYRWYLKGNPISDKLSIRLNHGDVYIMSAKAVGTDWKTRNKPTLRHSAGAPKFIN